MVTKIRHTFQNQHLRIYIFLVLPTLIVLIFSLAMTISFNRQYKDMFKKGYTEKLESTYRQNEMSLQSIVTTFHILADNLRFSGVVCGSSVDTEDINYSIKCLEQIKDDFNIIDNISIVNRTDKKVYSISGTYDLDNYFTKVYSYNDYTTGYWLKYQWPLAERCILSPSFVKSEKELKAVIPFVFTRLGNTRTGNLIIVDIDLSSIINNFENIKFTANSQLQIVNKQTYHIFDKTLDTSKTVDSDFFTRISGNTNTYFDYKTNGQKYYVVSFAPINSILGYTYNVLVPYNDITHHFSKNFFYMFILWLIILMFVFILTHISTNVIYRPVQNLLNLFPTNTNDRKYSDINILENSISKILDQNTALSKGVLPLAQEYYLNKLLNSNENYATKSSIDALKDNIIDFDYQYFCLIAVKLQPIGLFHDYYSSEAYYTIQSGIYDILYSGFSEQYKTYIISGENNTLYVLLNLKDELQADNIDKIIQDFLKAFENDKDLIAVNIETGSIYNGIEGLKKSYHEALDKLLGLSDFNKLSFDTSGISNVFSFNFTDESTIMNYLIAGKITEAKQCTLCVIERNTKKGISDAAIVQLYAQIFSLIFKVMRTKHIIYDTNNIGDMNLITKIISCPIDEIHNNMISLFTSMQNLSVAQKFDINKVIVYIQEHYKENLYLDILSDKYNVSSPYLSTLLKKSLGISFVDYLSHLKIDGVKKELLNTKKTINEIYIEFGFNNRNNFIRTFKKLVGTTPSEYRKNKM